MKWPRRIELVQCDGAMCHPQMALEDLTLRSHNASDKARRTNSSGALARVMQQEQTESATRVQFSIGMELTLNYI
ncbi:hypothetical protein ATANTOWER_021232 [Ataeniobius toweri]|uniref:Uncharacterized protein n=1 Tax=Ataeniobius toweri TaxID=208326 RepID=A0ABU7ACF8_9TELE|nr:hypothetical protein [Ataeniobius toweri]